MADVQSTLYSFIDKQSPKLATVLAYNWKQQQKSITYKEIHDAILDGTLDMSYLTDWQDLYTDFLNTTYGPMVEKAVAQAAKDLSATYGGNFFDPQPGLMDKFINEHGGKLIREVTEGQYKAINVLVKQAAMTDTMTVDQLARAIRPCVGLTQRQAQSVKNYYDNLIDEGYTSADALKKQNEYADKVHRRRAATIAQTELAFAYNAGADAVIKQNISDGTFAAGITKKWMTAFDERVCKVCGKIDGESVAFDAPFSIGANIPPAHPLCRCTVAYENVVPLAQPAPSTPAADAEQTEVQPTEDIPAEAAQAEQDSASTIPNAPTIGPLTYKGNEVLGTGQMYQYTDQDGAEWIFKPGQSKGGNIESFRAYVQEAGHKVQGIVDEQSAIPVKALTLETPSGEKFGAAQLRIKDTDPDFNLKAWQAGYGDAPTPKIIEQLQRENVTDWLMCNYDSHGGNFIYDSQVGRMFGVDKEQAFRYINKVDAQTMSLTYHPNSIYGETEPIYNTMYRKFANGELDIDLNNTLAYIKRVEAIPDDAYREIFRDYAEALYGQGSQAEDLLNKIVARKQVLRTTFEDFYSQILTERKGKPMTFVFADTVQTTTTATTFQTAGMSVDVLKTMTKKELQVIAKSKGMIYTGHMDKSMLVEALSDPSKADEMMAKAKAKINANAGNPVIRQPRKPKAAPAAPNTEVEGITKLSATMDDFDIALEEANIRGVVCISDKTALEGLQTNIRKITVDGRTAYEFNGKLTNSRWVQANKDIKSANAATGGWQFHPAQGTIDYKSPTLNLSTLGTQRYSRIPTQYIKSGDDVLVLAAKDCEDSARAMMGEFNVRVFAENGIDAAAKVKNLIDQANLTDIYEDVSPATLDRYKKMRLIWQNDPTLADTLDAAKSTDVEIDNVLKQIGITQERVDKLRLVKITDNYFTYVDDAAEAVIKDKNVAYVWNGVSSADSAASIIESGELTASAQRLRRGIIGSGCSVDSDIGSGGADSVFTRIAMKQDIGNQRFSASFASGEYQFVFDRKLLCRTDWYAYLDDEFGSTKSTNLWRRKSPADHFDALSQSYRDENEAMFRKSIPLDMLTEIRCDANYKRDNLLDMLRGKGITAINGKKIEDVIKVGRGKL